MKLPLPPPFSKGEISYPRSMGKIRFLPLSKRGKRFPPLEKGGKGGFERLFLMKGEYKMNLSKKVLYAVITGLFLAMYTVLPVRAEDARIGFIDAQKVLDESLRGKQVKDQLNEYVQSRQKIVDIEETELKNLQEEMTKQGAVLSPSAKQEKEELFQRKFMEYQKKVSELQKEIQQRRTDKLEEFNVELEKIAKILGEKEGYSMILTNLDVNIIIYAKPSLNLTDTVIQELDKELHKVKDDKK